jgi:hypothetical protein
MKRMFGNVKHAEFLSGGNKENQVFIPPTDTASSGTSLSYNIYYDIYH